MRIILLLTFLLPFAGCDTFPVRPNLDSCIEHMWIKGTYKVHSYNGQDIKLKNISGGEDRVISEFDSGWKEVRCP